LRVLPVNVTTPTGYSNANLARHRDVHAPGAAFDGGALSPYWDGPASHYLAQLIAEAMTA
jgi:hypothetical protein